MFIVHCLLWWRGVGWFNLPDAFLMLPFFVRCYRFVSRRPGVKLPVLAARLKEQYKPWSLNFHMESQNPPWSLGFTAESQSPRPNNQFRRTQFALPPNWDPSPSTISSYRYPDDFVRDWFIQNAASPMPPSNIPEEYHLFKTWGQWNGGCGGKTAFWSPGNPERGRRRPIPFLFVGRGRGAFTRSFINSLPYQFLFAFSSGHVFPQTCLWHEGVARMIKSSSLCCVFFPKKQPSNACLTCTC